MATALKPPVPQSAAPAASSNQPAGPAKSLGLVLGPFAAHGFAHALVKIRLVRLQVVDDFEVLFFHSTEVDTLDMDQSQQLANRLGHAAPALVARAAALSYSDPAPELLLVEAEAPANFARVNRIHQFPVLTNVVEKCAHAHASSMERAK